MAAIFNTTSHKTPFELVQELYSQTGHSMYYQQANITNPISTLTTTGVMGPSGVVGPLGTMGPAGTTGTAGTTWLGPGTNTITYQTPSGNTITYQPMPEYDENVSYTRLTLSTLMNYARAGQLTDEDLKVMEEIIAIHKENKEVDIDISI